MYRRSFVSSARRWSPNGPSAGGVAYQRGEVERVGGRQEIVRQAGQKRVAVQQFAPQIFGLPSLRTQSGCIGGSARNIRRH